MEVYEYADARTTVRPGQVKKPKPRKINREKGRFRMDNIYRARTEVKRLINANVGQHRRLGAETDKFLTLTYAEDMEDIIETNRDFHNFMKKLRYHHGAAEYVAVPEIQHEREKKYGVKVIHYHATLFGLTYIEASELAGLWGHGFVRINAVEDFENPGSYMAKYISKDFLENEFQGHRRYFCSQGLKRPEEIRAKSASEILSRLKIPEECKTFEVLYDNNSLVGAVMYRHYDLRKRYLNGQL